MSEDSSYYEYARNEMLEFVPDATKRLLDIGCAGGRFGDAVKRKIPGCEVWGIEPSPEAAAAAAERLDRVLNAELGTGDLPDAYFDVITMNDVLEHIPYSEPALALVKRHMKPGGRLVVSLPNVGYYLNVRDLVLREDWEYRDSGILDRTHLRFFTLKSAVRLLQDCGFKVLEARGLKPSRLKLHYRLLFALGFGAFDHMRYYQLAIVATPA